MPWLLFWVYTKCFSASVPWMSLRLVCVCFMRSLWRNSITFWPFVRSLVRWPIAPTVLTLTMSVDAPRCFIGDKVDVPFIKLSERVYSPFSSSILSFFTKVWVVNLKVVSDFYPDSFCAKSWLNYCSGTVCKLPRLRRFLQTSIVTILAASLKELGTTFLGLGSSTFLSSPASVKFLLASLIGFASWLVSLAK